MILKTQAEDVGTIISYDHTESFRCPSSIYGAPTGSLVLTLGEHSIHAASFSMPPFNWADTIMI